MGSVSHRHCPAWFLTRSAFSLQSGRTSWPRLLWRSSPPLPFIPLQHNHHAVMELSIFRLRHQPRLHRVLRLHAVKTLSFHRLPRLLRRHSQRDDPHPRHLQVPSVPLLHTIMRRARPAPPCRQPHRVPHKSPHRPNSPNEVSTQFMFVRCQLVFVSGFLLLLVHIGCRSLVFLVFHSER